MAGGHLDDTWMMSSGLRGLLQVDLVTAGTRLVPPAASRGRIAVWYPCPGSAQDGAEPSEAGAIPALSRNGNAPRGDEPGRLTRADDLSSEEGRFVPAPRWRRGGRTSSSRPDGG